MRERESKREERLSIGVVRGRTCLYYTKGTNGGTRRPRGLPLMMLYSRLPRSLVPNSPLRAARSTFSRTGCVYRSRIVDFALRSTSKDLPAGGAGIQSRKESARSLNAQLLLLPSYLAFPRARRSYSPHCYRNKD